VRVANGARYYFRVGAHDGAGYGALSTTVNAMARTVPLARPNCTASRCFVDLDLHAEIGHRTTG
jgi:hypothetical protein